MALGAKLIAATLILGASTVGTYAIANGGLGGLSSEGDSSTSTEETGNQKPVSEEGSAGTGETSVRAEPVPNVDTPQIQSQPVQASVPEAKEDGTTVDNRVAQEGREEKGEEVEGAGVTLPVTPPAESPRDGSPATSLPERSSEDLAGTTVNAQEKDPKVVSNVEAEVASDLEHSPAGATVQQPAAGSQDGNLRDTSHTAEPANGENQHTNTNEDGGVQNNPVTDQSNNNVDSDKEKQIKAVPGNTDPNKGASGGAGTEPQNTASDSTQLETTTPEAGSSNASQNPTNNEQEGTSLGDQNSNHA